MRTVRVTLVCVVLWLTPTVLAGWSCGWGSTLFREGLFFSKASVVTFGGAYAVLPYVAQEALNHYGWLHPGQMMDGLGLAETTPGPLIMVVQFVGFMGAWQHSDGMSPVLAATLGSLITTWSTFTPCFLWIFAGGPYIEQLRDNTKLTDALSAITAAVVGVILNLAVWFGLHVFFPQAGVIDWFAMVVCAVALFGLLRWKWNVIPVVLGSGLFGLAWKFIHG
jgi:chromate transporter